MNISVHTKNTSPELNQNASTEQKVAIVERLDKALKNVNQHIRDVEVYIEDETPNSQKFDGRCRMTVHLLKGEPVSVDGRGDSFGETVADSIKKVQHSVETICRKRIDKRRRPNDALA